MKKEDILKRRERFKYRRNCTSDVPLVNADMHTNMRQLLNRIARGESVDKMPKEHVPLPPDGEIEDDFDTGTEEILDIVDAMAIKDAVDSKIDEYKAQQAEKAKQQADDAFEQRVAAEVAARLQKQQE